MKKHELHELKTWPDPFEAILRGDKHHEIRRTDREFKVNDELLLREWRNEQSSYYEVVNTVATWVTRPAHYTGREIHCRVTYLSSGGTWGLPADLCVMSIEVLS